MLWISVASELNLTSPSARRSRLQLSADHVAVQCLSPLCDSMFMWCSCARVPHRLRSPPGTEGTAGTAGTAGTPGTPGEEGVAGTAGTARTPLLLGGSGGSGASGASAGSPGSGGSGASGASGASATSASSLLGAGVEAVTGAADEGETRVPEAAAGVEAGLG